MNKIPQQDIEALIELFERSDWRQISLSGGGIDLFISKDRSVRRSDTFLTSPLAVASTVDPAAPALAPAPATTPRNGPPVHWQPVRAPTVGTFYSAPKPGDAPFVSVGERVTAETEMCLIEVMKLFTTVRAGAAGFVREAIVNDGQLVEFDQVLFYIEPAAGVGIGRSGRMTRT